MRAVNSDSSSIATRSIALALLCVLAASPAFAGWAPEFSPPGVNSEVLELAVHDGHLIVAGWLTRAGDISSPGVARWDGGHWESMDGRNSHRFSGFAEFHGDLVVAASWVVTAAGDTIRTLARWDGSDWTPVGGGFGGDYPYVACLSAHNGVLYAGGRVHRGGLSAPRHRRPWSPECQRNSVTRSGPMDGGRSGWQR